MRIAIELALHQFAFRQSAAEAKIIPLNKSVEKDSNSPTDETILAINDAIFVKQNYRFLKVIVHRSFAINLQHLDTFNDSFMVIGKHEVPLGRNYNEEFFKHFNFL